MHFIQGLLIIFSLFPLSSVAQVSTIRPMSTGAYFLPAAEAPVAYGLNEINVQHTHALLRWSCEASAGDFKVLVRVVGDSCWSQRHYVAGEARHFQLFGLQPHTAYEWTVRLVGAECCYAAATCKSFKTLAEPCSRPAELAAVPSAVGTVVLFWAPVATADRYKLRFRQLGNTVWNTVVIASSEASHELSCLLPGITYEWKMKTLCQPGHVAGTSWTATYRFKTSIPLQRNAIEECVYPVSMDAVVLP